MADDHRVPESLLERLACPRDFGPLSISQSNGLMCANGHEYRVIQGVPVLLDEQQDPTLWVGRASVEAARGDAALDRLLPGHYLETLGLSEAQRAAIAELARQGGSVDPVVAYMIGATNGILYENLIGKLHEYPIPEFLLPQSHGERLIDIGCNWGRWSIAAARKGYDVVGIDPSLGATLAASRVARQLGVSAHFVVADARALPFRPGSFDWAFSYSVLQHFARQNVVLALRQVRRVLTSSGSTLIQMAHRNGIRSLYHQARRRFREPEGFEVRYWSLRDLKATFEAELGKAAEVRVDCFFGLGLQPADARFMPPAHRALLRASESLRRASRLVRGLHWAADSLYLRTASGRAEEMRGAGTAPSPTDRAGHANQNI